VPPSKKEAQRKENSPMHRLVPPATAFALAGFLAAPAVAEDYPWKPDRPIQIIVPWSPGGATDQVTRVLAADLEDALGQNVVVINQPGASGVVGTTNAWQAPRDGYTWAAGAPADLGLYQLRGTLDVSLAEWRLYIHIANVVVVSANVDRPWQDFGELLEHIRANPGQVSVATSGIASTGHHVIEEISVAAGGIDYIHVPYDGGNPAVIATVSGEADITTQLLSEQAEMIRAGRLRPLAVIQDRPLELAGVGRVQPITDWLPELALVPEHFGIWAPHDIPAEVRETMDRVWRERIFTSERIQAYTAQRGALFDPSYGFDAYLKALPKVAEFAWRFYREGQIERNPGSLGIPQLD
jgi:tripartite-type tricarboxylate transporter receptor subunit TctC